MDKLEKPRVLLVDDNEPTCTLITALLRKEFEIDVAGDGLEAIEKLRINQYEAVILDLLMPEVDGYGVLGFLKGHNATMLRRVLVLTAGLTALDISRIQEYEVCTIMSKPFEVETLLAAVKQCVDHSSPKHHFLSGGMIFLLADLLRQRWM